jgi:hypothetical protein
MSDQQGVPPINVISALPMFAPNSLGGERLITALTLIGVNQLFPFLGEYLEKIGRKLAIPVSSELFCADPAARETARRLKGLFDTYRSDKALHHDYHLIYSVLLNEPDRVTDLLEIGIGSNYPDMPSNVGATGRPGASLRAFRDFLPNAQIVGADVDRRILFQEDRIRTFFVNQLERASFSTLEAECAREFDLIIDDGLHAPSANVSVLIFAIGRLKVGGWCVIEDIKKEALPIWQVVAALVPDTYRVQLISGRISLVFAIQRLS